VIGTLGIIFFVISFSLAFFHLFIVKNILNFLRLFEVCTKSSFGFSSGFGNLNNLSVLFIFFQNFLSLSFESFSYDSSIFLTFLIVKTVYFLFSSFIVSAIFSTTFSWQCYYYRILLNDKNDCLGPL